MDAACFNENTLRFLSGVVDLSKDRYDILSIHHWWQHMTTTTTPQQLAAHYPPLLEPPATIITTNHLQILAPSPLLITGTT